MLPTLIQIGPLRISSLGFFMLLSFFAVAFLLWREARREYLDEEKITDIFLLSALAGIIGARITFILLNPDLFGFNILRMLLPTWMPGFYPLGGLAAAFAVAYPISLQKKIEFGKLLDAAVGPLLLGAAIYKVGQFLDGSLLGVETDMPIGFPAVGEEGRFLPLPLLEATIFILLYVAAARLREYFVVKRKLKGGLFLALLGAAGFVELLLSPLVREPETAFGISLGLILFAAAFGISVTMLYSKTRSLKNDFSLIRSRLSSISSPLRKS